MVDFLTAVLADAPVVALTLDETTGDFLDQSGNGYDFTPGAGVTRGLATGMRRGGHAVSGSGSAEIAKRSALPSSLTGSDYTLEAIIDMPAGNVRGGIIKIGAAGVGGTLGIGNNRSDQVGRFIVFGANGINWWGSSIPIPTGKQYLAVTRSGGTVVFYLNGAAVNTLSVGSVTAASGGEMWIGNEEGIFLDSGVKVDAANIYPTALTAAQILAHYQADRGDISTPYEAAVLADTPRAFYRFDEASGTAAVDKTGHGYDGAMTVQTRAPGPAGSSLEFIRASGSYVSIPAGILGTGDRPHTIEAWYYTGAQDSRQGIVWYGSSAGTGVFKNVIGMRLDGSVQALEFWWGDDALATIGLHLYEWTHLVWTYDGTNRRCYLNGVLTDTIPSSGLNLDPGPGRIGATTIGSEFFAGNLAEVAIYDYAVSGARLAAHYAIGSGALIPIPESIAADSTSDAVVSGTVSGGAISGTVVADGDADAVATGVLTISSTVDADSSSDLLGEGLFGAVIVSTTITADSTSDATALGAPGTMGTIMSRAESDVQISGVVTEAPPAPVRTKRWVLTDVATATSWEMPISPDSMSPLPYEPRRQMRHGFGKRRDQRIRTMVGKPRAPEWSFSGVIRTRAHHDQLALWARNSGEVIITDHMGRQITVFFTSYEPVDRRPNAYTPWRMRYTMKCYVLEVS